MRDARNHPTQASESEGRSTDRLTMGLFLPLVASMVGLLNRLFKDRKGIPRGALLSFVVSGGGFRASAGRRLCFQYSICHLRYRASTSGVAWLAARRATGQIH